MTEIVVEGEPVSRLKLRTLHSSSHTVKKKVACQNSPRQYILKLSNVCSEKLKAKYHMCLFFRDDGDENTYCEIRFAISSSLSWRGIFFFIKLNDAWKTQNADKVEKVGRHTYVHVSVGRCDVSNENFKRDLIYFKKDSAPILTGWINFTAGTTVIFFQLCIIIMK